MKSIRSRGVRVLVSLIVVWVAMAAGGSYRLEAQPTGLPPEVIAYADVVLYNGKILTADDQFSTAEAVAIRDGKFLAVGERNWILPMAGPQTRKIDLKGKTATPGFIDTHQHPTSSGMRVHWMTKYDVQWEGRAPNSDRLNWTSLDMALRDIQSAVKAAKPGEAVLIPGRFTPFCNSARLKQIDALSPNNPLVLIGPVNNWPDAANSKVASLVKKFVGNDPVFRKEGSPCLSIAAREAVSSYFYSHIPFDELIEGSRLAVRMASRRGITTAKEHTALPFITGVRELWDRGELTVRMRMPYPFYPLTGNQTIIPTGEAEKFFMYAANLSGIGDDMFRLVCIRPSAVGGNFATGSSWTLEPKRQELPGMKERPHGLSSGQWDPDVGSYLTGEGESFAGRESLVQAIRYGWDVATDHTVGDRAVEEVLKAMEEGLRTRVVERPGQILAMGHMPMASREQIRRMKELGVRPGIGPWHVFTERMIEPALFQFGIETINQLEMFRSYIDAGVKPSLEGDTFGEPTFWKLYAAITRKDQKYGRVWYPQERVTRQEALWMSTNWPAYQLGEEDKLGTIEVGKLADLIVIDKDYMTIPEDEIPEIDVLLTIVGGKVVYEVEGGLQ